MGNTPANRPHRTGCALLSLGFRPFFLGAALWAVVAMLTWIAMLVGDLPFSPWPDPVSWHAHAFLYGYLSAVIAGFLLTAVPNWTGRAPLVGVPLACLVALWIAERIAVTFIGGIAPLASAVIDMAMPVALSLIIGREIIAAQNWRNMIVVALLLVYTLGNAVFHWEAARGFYPAQGYGLRLGLGASVLMIAVIGGRVVPAFTRNWLVKQGARRLPTPPMQPFDKTALGVLLLALVAWVIAPFSVVTALALGIAGVLHLIRLARWAGPGTRPEPLILVLHVSYAFVPLGALALGIEGVWPGLTGLGAAQHLWMAGAIGLMTMAMMTRATLGHSGRALRAGAGTNAVFVALLGATLTRLAAGIWPGMATGLYTMSAALWIAGFAGFAVLYGPLLLRPRPRNPGPDTA